MNEARRFNRGTGLPYSRASRDKVDIFLDEQALIKPLRWKQPRIIFQNSMTDTFAEFVKDEWRDKILAVAGLTPRHHYLLLTKRAREMTRYIQSLDVHQYHSTMYGIPDLGKRHLSERLVEMRFGRTVDTWRMFAVDAFVLGFPIRNVSLGFSAENQECFDKRYREVAPLIEAGWKIWCSFEPLLGPIRIPNERKLSYSVIGGDSGVGFRAMKVEWLIRLAAQLQAAGVPIHIKQDSGLYPGQQGRIPNELWKLKASVK
jgi:protein gp37